MVQCSIHVVERIQNKGKKTKLYQGYHVSIVNYNLYIKVNQKVAFIQVRLKVAKYEIQEPSTCHATSANCYMTNCEFDKVDPCSTFRNNFLQPTAKIFVM